jgi:hypothetical protein
MEFCVCAPRNRHNPFHLDQGWHYHPLLGWVFINFLYLKIEKVREFRPRWHPPRSLWWVRVTSCYSQSKRRPMIQAMFTIIGNPQNAFTMQIHSYTPSNPTKRLNISLSKSYFIDWVYCLNLIIGRPRNMLVCNRSLQLRICGVYTNSSLHSSITQ